MKKSTCSHSNCIHESEKFESPIKKMNQNQNEELSASITQTWTQQAIECFQLSSNCSKCSISKGDYSFECRMPKVIEQLLTDLGKPA